MAALIALVVILVFALFVAAKTIRIIPQARAGVVERLGRYSRTLEPGLTIVMPFIDRVKPLIDLREQVVTFPPQRVITEDNVTVNIDTVLYFTITDPKSASYEVANPLQAIEQLTVTTLRNVIGGLTLEQSLTSRDQINTQLRIVLDEATGKWGIRINRVELKAVDPPGRDPGGDGEADARRARPPRRDPHRRGLQAVADPHRRGREAVGGPARRGRARPRRSCAPRARRRRSTPSSTPSTRATRTPSCSAYQYLQMLPKLAEGDANKMWVIPSGVHGRAGRAVQRVHRRAARSRSRGRRRRRSPRARSHRLSCDLARRGYVQRP